MNSQSCNTPSFGLRSTTQRQGSQHPRANCNVSSASLPRWGIWGWYGLGGSAKHENWGEKGQEGKAKATWGFLRVGADAENLVPFANRAPLKPGYPLFDPLGLRRTRAAGSTTTWCLATTSTFPPLCPSETGKCNLFHRWGTRAWRPAGFMEVTGNQNKSQVRPVTSGTSFLSSGTGLWVQSGLDITELLSRERRGFYECEGVNLPWSD